MLQIFSDVQHLWRHARPIIWILFLLKFLESYCIFVIAYSLILYLSTEFDFGDEEAGFTYGFLGMLASIYGLCFGFLIDVCGLRRSLLCGFGTLSVARFSLAFATRTEVLFPLLFCFIPAGQAFAVPVLQIGVSRAVKRSNSPDKARDTSTAFSLFYLVLNLAAITAAPALDIFHRLVILPKQEEGNEHGMLGFRFLIATAGAVSFLSWLLAFIYFPGEEEEEEEEFNEDFFEVKKKNDQSPWTNKNFVTFVLFGAILTFVKLVNRTLDTLFPTFFVRVLGEHAPYGSVIAINPILIILLVPVIGAFSSKHMSSYSMIILGTSIAAAAPLALVREGDYFMSSVHFMMALSVGEACWGPRFYEYTIAVADKGQEGAFAAAGQLPPYLSTLVGGTLSGFLLEHFCPEKAEGSVLEPARETHLMWFLVACCGSVTPMILSLFRQQLDGQWAKEQLTTNAFGRSPFKGTNNKELPFGVK